jgi:DNA-binding transcriptional ArsR family regulator
LGDPTRRVLCEHLAAGPLPVGQLAARVPVSRPAVSQHLKVLKRAGLVVDRADGNRRVYALDPTGVATLHTWLDRIWRDALMAFKTAAEQPVQEKT